MKTKTNTEKTDSPALAVGCSDLFDHIETPPCFHCGERGVDSACKLTDGTKIWLHDKCQALYMMKMEDKINSTIKEFFPNAREMDIAGESVKKAILSNVKFNHLRTN